LTSRSTETEASAASILANRDWLDPSRFAVLRLRPTLLHAHVTQEAGEGKLELDEGRLLWGELEEILGVSDAPAGTFEAILPVLTHL